MMSKVFFSFSFPSAVRWLCVLGMLVPFTQFLPAQQQTRARGMTDKERRQQEERLRKELESPYKRWLDQEVVWIISDEERSAFKKLETDDERQNFIEAFWMRRDPTPDTIENEFREEHYRRIAWANDRFASGIPGWKTDRGMVYIKFGAPDEREEHPTGGNYNRTIAEGGGNTTTYPFERWRYRYLEGVGTNVIIEFVDKSMTNEYRMTWNPQDKDALLMVPGQGLTLYEQMGLSSKFNRVYNNPQGNALGPNQGLSSQNVFDRLQQYANIQKAGRGVQFKDLEAMVDSKIRYDLLPMKVRTDYIAATAASVLTYITVEFDRRDLQFETKDELAKATVNLYMSIQSVTRRPIGRPIEETVTVGPFPAERMADVIEGKAIYQTARALQPGRYRLNVVAKDIVGDNTSTSEFALDVPYVREDRLGTSSLILADVLEEVPTRNIGTGMFVIGANKVRPKMDDTFRADQTLGIYMQIYNFQPDEVTKKPQGNVTYQIVKNGAEEAAFQYSEDLTKFSGGASQVVVARRLPLAKLGLDPGDYTLRVEVKDELRDEVKTEAATFTVN